MTTTPSSDVPSSSPSAEPEGFVVLRQNDPHWGGNQLGERTKDDRVYTIGAAGCLLVCLAMASNFLLKTAIRPGWLNAYLMAKGDCFLGPLLVFEHAARVALLKAPDSDRVRSTVKTRNTRFLATQIKAAFASSKICVLHVDHNNDKGGDPYGDHFVVATLLHGNVLICADPASGQHCTIDVDTCDGDSVWIPAHDVHNEDGSVTHRDAVVKHYQVVGVIPVGIGGAS